MKEEEALQIYDLFQWAMDEGFLKISIGTFKTKYPTGMVQEWSAFFFRENYEERFYVEAKSIKELYRKMEAFMLSGKGAKKVEVNDEDLL